LLRRRRFLRSSHSHRSLRSACLSAWMPCC
jgi:hypothetical protein